MAAAEARDRFKLGTLGDVVAMIKCPICPVEFDAIAGLQEHLKLVHGAK